MALNIRSLECDKLVKLYADLPRKYMRLLTSVLRAHERLTLGYKEKEEDGAIQQRYLRLNSRLEPEHLEVYKMFNLSGVPLPRKKLAVQSVVTNTMS